MMNHLIANNLKSKDQHGFTKLKSFVTNLLETIDVITETLNRGFYVLLDFAKQLFIFLPLDLNIVKKIY